jgi:hypothetical protein
MDRKEYVTDESSPLVTQDMPAPFVRTGPRTGPKGVLADYAHFKRVERERVEEATKRQLSLISTPSKPQNSSQDEDELDEEEEKIMQKYREQRILEMQLSRTRPAFGTLLTVDSETFVDAIDKEAPHVPVVIHLYEHYIQECATVNAFLVEMAKDYPYAKFLRIRASEADQEFDTVALPALLVYKGGLLKYNWMRILDTLRETNGGIEPTAELMEEYLYNQGVLSDLEK